GVLFLPAAAVQLFVPPVAAPADGGRARVAEPIACPPQPWRRRAPRNTARVLDRRDRRVLLVLGGQAGSLHFPDRACRGGAGRPGGRARPGGGSVADVAVGDAGDRRGGGPGGRRGPCPSPFGGRRGFPALPPPLPSPRPPSPQ